MTTHQLRRRSEPAEPDEKGRSGRRLALLLALLHGLAGLGVSAQEEPELPVPPAFLEEIEVDVVEVEVVVTDRSGNPVLGLEAKDFEVFENRAPVEITNFYAVEAGRRRYSEPVPSGSSPALEPSGAYLVIFVDGTTLRPGARQQLVKELSKHLDRLVAAAAGVMVVYQGGSVSVETTFTTDVALVRQALEQIARRAQINSNSTSQSFILREIENGADPRLARLAPNPIAADDLLQRAINDGITTLASSRSHAATVFHNLQVSQSQLRNFVSSLAGLPGRKAILYLSNGHELRPAEVLFRTWWEKYQEVAAEIGVTSADSEAERYDARPMSQQLVAHAAANGVAFYPIDASDGGLAAYSAEVRSMTTSSIIYEQLYEQEGALSFLSVGTGGLSGIGSGGIKHLVEEMTRGFESYYSLGYVSPRGRDGGRRRIDVDVKGERMRVRHAREYLDKTTAEEMKDRTLAALYLDVADNPLDIGVELGDERREKGGRFILPVVLKIPIAKLTLLPEEDRHVARLSVVFVAQDKRGMSDPVRTELPITIPNPHLLAAMTQEAAFSAELAVRGGEQKLAIGVRDEIGRVESTLNLVTTVGRETGGP